MTESLIYRISFAFTSSFYRISFALERVIYEREAKEKREKSGFDSTQSTHFLGKLFLFCSKWYFSKSFCNIKSTIFSNNCVLLQQYM